jgi:hypothetical protein
MPKHKTTRARPKALYRVHNWPEYEQALRQRSSITFWLSPDVAQTWCYGGEKQRGSQFTYSDQAIQIMLTIKEVFHLTNRGVEGFVRSLFGLRGLALPVPDHTTLSKRSRHLAVSLPRQASGPLHLVLDSTGLKLYGEGEWKVRQHGHAKHRTWRKLHVGLEPDSGEIQAMVLTTNSVTDGQAVPALLAQLAGPLLSCSGDGSYDKRPVYQALQAHSPTAQVVIPPRQDAHIWQHGNSKAERLKRDENLRYIRQHGRRAWKESVGYHRRSLAETLMFRLRTIFSDRLSARRLDAQVTQAWIRCRALNQMTHLTMPQSYLVQA